MVTYTYTTTSSGDAGTFAAIFLSILVVALITYAIYAIFLGMIFKKAGQESWPAWVPVYQTWKMLEIGGQSGFWAVLALIPVINIVSLVFTIIAMYEIGLKLGKSGAFVLLGIFLPYIWLIWLAVDKSVWEGSQPVAATPVPEATPPVQPQPVQSMSDVTPATQPTQPVAAEPQNQDVQPEDTPSEEPPTSA